MAESWDSIETFHTRSFQAINEGFNESEGQSHAGIVWRNVVFGFGITTYFQPLLICREHQNARLTKIILQNLGAHMSQ
jgi:hypothetical protein